MIRFCCMYCGRKIRARSRAGGKRAHCPGCGHALTVPLSTRAARATLAAAGEEKALAWEGRSNKDIARLLLKKKSIAPEDRSRVAARAMASPWLPRYDELTLFVLSAAFLMLLAISPGIRADIPGAMRFFDGLESLLAVAAIGMVFSLFAIFFRGHKPQLVKLPMLVFAVLVTAGTGIYAGIVVVTTSGSWLMIFPAWNIMNGVLLLLMAYAGVLDTECIVDRGARFPQAVALLICVGAVLAVCEYMFKLHWAITYSVCVGYTMGLHHSITSVFGAAAIEEN